MVKKGELDKGTFQRFIQILSRTEKEHLNDYMKNNKKVKEQYIVEDDSMEAEKALSGIDVNKYCSTSGVPPMVTKILNALPENLKGPAKDFIKKFGNAVSNKSVKELLSIRKQIKDRTQSSESMNEQVAPLVIAGLAISPSLLIAIGAILLIIIIFVIINNSGKKGGSCNPGWWDDL